VELDRNKGIKPRRENLPMLPLSPLPCLFCDNLTR